MRRLIINADDLGLTEGVNRAIFEGHESGVVTSATLMANGASLQDAVAPLRSSRYVKLSVGCHLGLVDGHPVSPPEMIPTLVEGTEFRRSVVKLGMAARAGRLSAEQIASEATAQFRMLQAQGIRLSHFDAHKHSHMFPEILEPALSAAVTCGIRAVRNPFESARPIPLSMLLAAPKVLKRYLQVMMLRTLRSRWMKIVKKHGLTTPDGSLGVIVTGELNERFLRVLLEQMPEGTWELVCHPGYDDASLANVRTRLRKSRETEVAVLTSPATRRLIESLGIELISYSDL